MSPGCGCVGGLGVVPCGNRNSQSSRQEPGEGRAPSTHRSRFPQTLFPGLLTAGWLHGHSHRPGEGSETGDKSPQNCLLWAPCAQSPSTSCPPAHLLVLLQGDTGLSPILRLNEEQLIPLDVFKNALGRGQQAGQAAGWWKVD